MCNIGDVFNSSFGSAADMNHALYEYGKGSMGIGIRKLFGEIYSTGYSTGYNKGCLSTSIIWMCGISVVTAGRWCAQKWTDHQKEKIKQFRMTESGKSNIKKTNDIRK